jgi:hypothetical protein
MTSHTTEREDHLNAWLAIVKGEYQEMPGLQLTRQQVRKLWGLDEATCDALLERLLKAHFLRITSNGCYVLDDEAPGGCPSAHRTTDPRMLPCG